MLKTSVHLIALLMIFSVAGCFRSVSRAHLDDSGVELFEDAETTESDSAIEEDAYVNVEEKPPRNEPNPNEVDAKESSQTQGSCTNKGDGGRTTGHLVDSVTLDPVSGVTIEVLDNDTGDKLGISTVTQVDGSYTFDNLPKGIVGLLAAAVDADAKGVERLDSFTFNVPSGVINQDIYSMTRAISEFFTHENNKGNVQSIVYGRVYFYDENCNSWPVECATVQADQPADLVYFGNTHLPDSNVNETSANGTFILMNDSVVGDPATTITAYIDGEPIGSTSFPWVFPEQTDQDRPAGNVYFIDLYADGRHQLLGCLEHMTIQ